ncbi:darcynin family protein [Ideonella livida]|uniref:Darcynin n=1 Tax=Ideonella livida TaxID=2707176 RepID=A0A7C9TMP4_9BURK|nr:darcynin family protein [Ideonella livida]NDY91826.1 hypothetical protein [Ideonella livida]
MTYTVIVTYTFHPDWLRKTWEERAAYERQHIRPVFERFAGEVSVRFFDAEAFSARCSDFMIFETADLKSYYFLIESLRESPVFRDGLVTFQDVLIGIEDGFRTYEREMLAPPPSSSPAPATA